MPKITKAIIPVAGWGTRRLPITKIIEKSMLPVGNRPLVDYSVQELISAGITDIYMVVSNTEPCQVREYYRDNVALNKYLTERGKMDRLELAKTLPDNVRIHYTVQDPSGKYGTAVPIAMVVEEYNIDEPVIVFMGDDLIWNPNGPSAAELLMNGVTESGFGSAILGLTMDKSEISKFAALSRDDEGCLSGIVEKPAPEEAPTNLASVGKYVLSPELQQEIVKYVHENDFGAGDQEYMITDPIDTFISRGGRMKVIEAEGEQLDGGTLEGWIHANNVVCGGDA
ncbi:hypothetical protein IJJ18_01115 [Candidatus Saccharibacteria bacterium]|nr:hypothetical protein [Candidatus Saccharibacteria bacterium]